MLGDQSGDKTVAGTQRLLNRLAVDQVKGLGKFRAFGGFTGTDAFPASLSERRIEISVVVVSHAAFENTTQLRLDLKLR